MKKSIFISCMLFFALQGVSFSIPSDEIIIKQGAASLQEDIEHITGRLYLTGTKLVFESSGLNFRGGSTTIPLENIANADKGWSKLLGIVPAVPNALKITLKDGKVYRFTCWWPSRWKNAVENQIKTKI
ncbi:MAG: hypothetical protein BWY44_00798 [Candidatus Omnitrophica bacterium ADurb.Bin292]|nr:MAG: hypothetical protein BWY44_00798 [Candidatus Omnitrophica bacterium ADurb.Bin292]